MIDYTHFETAVAKLLFAPDAVMANRARKLEIIRIFDSYDSDDDGFLSLHEFRELCYDLFPHIAKPEAALQELGIAHVLTGKVDKISLHEFSLWKGVCDAELLG